MARLTAPSDLTQILRSPASCQALLNLDAQLATNELTSYLCEPVDLGRRDWWFKSLCEVVESGIARPILAGTSAYPTKLAECWDALPVLFSSGAIPTAPSVAIVGSRETTPAALDDA